MKTLKKVSLIVMVLTVLIGIVIVTAPSKTHISRSVMIKAPSKLIFQNLLIMKNFNSWSPWRKKDLNTKYEFFGPLMGVDSGMSWESEDEQVGNGEMRIKEVIYPTTVTYLIKFGPSQATASMILNEFEIGTEVTWTYDEVEISGFNKFFALLTETFIGPDYEEGLFNLKNMMEKAPVSTSDMEIMLSTSRSYIGTKDTLAASMDMISAKLAKSYGDILSYADRNRIEQEGPPIMFTLKAGEVFEFIAGIPMKANSVDSESLMLRATPEGYELRASYYGPYKAMEPTYTEMESLIGFLNMVSASAPWEEYITDPGLEPNPEYRLTYIHWPIKYRE